jgi:oligopeptide transport system ATP-binding protein
VTIQAQILELIADLQQRLQLAVLLITHDLGVVADVADKITVMYAGQVVEQSPIADLYADPLHPYSRGLLSSIPRIDHKGEVLYAIKGLPPNLTKIPPGCSFAPRCEFAQDRCREGDPPILTTIEGERRSACHFTEELRNAAH